MSKVAIIYWSQTGNTEAMADAILAGAKEAGADATLFSVSEINADTAASYDRLALGCPAMGDEVLEETEFEPFFCELESRLSGKKVGLFGSYGWGDGQWMRDWQDRLASTGAFLINEEGLMINAAPDSQGVTQCKELGKALAAE